MLVLSHSVLDGRMGNLLGDSALVTVRLNDQSAGICVFKRLCACTSTVCINVVDNAMNQAC